MGVRGFHVPSRVRSSIHTVIASPLSHLIVGDEWEKALEVKKQGWKEHVAKEALAARLEC
ncbi:hypothetical protein Scep_025855 [Stephania cephalantha]|uniref:Uncharacterized protein n=1 Tax=Stephania cephalantha TaxID=152367 RepID=A0AAP0EJ11_9MAGN